MGKDMKFETSDQLESRKIRLEKFFKLATAILGMKEKHLEELIEEIRDNKGKLVIEWKKELPTSHQREVFGNAWEMCGESKKSVFHNLNIDSFFNQVDSGEI